MKKVEIDTKYNRALRCLWSHSYKTQQKRYADEVGVKDAMFKIAEYLLLLVGDIVC